MTCSSRSNFQFGLVQLWKEIVEKGIIKAGAQKLNDSSLNFKSRR